MIPKITSVEEYHSAYQRSLQDPQGFWADIAASFHWKKKWDTVFEGGFEHADFRWFNGGQLNITENCLDRHLRYHSAKTALIWEPNNPDEQGRTLTYEQLIADVCRCANMLRQLGLKKGQTVCIYLPMIPELIVSVLACARLGVVHSVVFAGFSAQSLANRIQDAQCSILITADGFYRGTKWVPLKQMSEEALAQCPSVRHVVVVRRTNQEITMQPQRDVYWDQYMATCHSWCDAVPVEAEDPLFILYTSGSTGKPKGILHTTGGYMVYAGYTFANVFQYRDNEIYWCTADVGWITGHTYVVYGPLLNAATIVLFEGIPSYPDWSRWWQIIDKYKVNIFYTAPTAIRSLELQGDAPLENVDLSSLRVLGSVGEPLNEQAWYWFHEKIGKRQCPIVDTWWQTETGGIMISSLAGVTPQKPAHPGWPLPGIEPVIVDETGKPVLQQVGEGNLCIARSWPGQARTIFNDHERFLQTYFRVVPGLYFSGDGCRRNQENFYRITGRVDDVIKVSGHRLGTAEIENAINQHPQVVECAVINVPDAITGEAIIAFVLGTVSAEHSEQLTQEIMDLVVRSIGPIAKPKQIHVVSGLPKTRSGKIMRRILRKLAENKPDEVGDVTTLLNPEVVEEIQQLLQHRS